jgi:formylglycine-generating enzyme required for sulfatase activity
VRNFLQLLFLISHISFIDMAYSENIDNGNITDDMVMIASGKFQMGCNQFGPMHGAPNHLVYLNEFMIDRFEVTNKIFERIIPDHNLRRSRLSNCDECPVTNVSWYEAADYCYLIGKTLPTEAQWEKAAGESDGCAFPWGKDFDLNQNQGRGGLEMKDKSAPVGSYPPNINGIYDMGGNVWEWVSDWMAPGYQVSDVLIDPRGPNSGIMKVRRGGAYSDSIKAMATGYRDWSHPSSRYFSDIGFRCAINVKGKYLHGLPTQN